MLRLSFWKPDFTVPKVSAITTGEEVAVHVALDMFSRGEPATLKTQQRVTRK